MKKIIIIFILLMISYCTGVFIEIAVPSGASISSDFPTFGDGIWQNIKNDVSTLLLSLFFALSVWLLPFAGLLLLSKSFALGFSSAFLLSGSDFSREILFAVLFPRACLKLPAYVLLMYISLDVAKYVQGKGRRNQQKKEVICYITEKAAFVLLCLFISSLTEAVLMQLVF